MWKSNIDQLSLKKPLVKVAQILICDFVVHLLFLLAFFKISVFVVALYIRRRSILGVVYLHF